MSIIATLAFVLALALAFAPFAPFFIVFLHHGVTRLITVMLLLELMLPLHFLGVPIS